ncbi:hypothetical protein B484DRAFT_451146 [Ochromonadaceae sp. CCMP2298]|nr:hypothetical protein B484DRAFT_451146 [Ochromonadaceae sp. CCMP2298]|mmetsp:Transcript_10904/g.24170  ORF Transcript_10904/g.24170 Transcript_10904/m.24170 type:complete len:424 (+) Transcript_10904:43-1314(+)
MGHASSVVRDAYALPTIGNLDRTVGRKELCEKKEVRAAFADFIKSGAWMDDLAESETAYGDSLSKQSSTGQLFSAQNRLSDYNIDNEKRYLVLDALATSRDGKDHPSTKDPISCFSGKALSARSGSGKSVSAKSNSGKSGRTQGTLSSKSNDDSSPSSKSHYLLVTANEEFNTIYSNVDECSYFSADQLSLFMMAILWPLFLRSEEYQRFEKYGLKGEAGEDSDGECTPRGAVAAEEVTSKRSQRMQQVMHACACIVDEAAIAERLRSGQWLADLQQAVDSYRLAVTVCDSSASHTVVYCNKAYATLSGCRKKDIVGQSLLRLAGRETEAIQALALSAAIRKGQSAKVGISLRSGSGVPFMDLIASSPLWDNNTWSVDCDEEAEAGSRFSVQVHCPVSFHGGTVMEDINNVDDTAMLLAYLMN